MISDPIAWLFSLFARLVGWMIGSVLLGGRILIERGLASSATRPIKQSPAVPNAQVSEAERQAGCKQIALSYATHLGYIARECMSREEVERLIDGGIAPQDLANELATRIDECPGIILGKQSYQNHEIKLPYYPYRSRHAYIIGRSGRVIASKS